MRSILLIIRRAAALALVAAMLQTGIPVIVGAHSWKAPAAAAKKANPVTPDDASVQRGQKTYRKYCLMCHGPFAQGDGLAARSLDVQPADLVERLKSHSEGDFYWKIMNGRLPMPGFKDQMTDQEVWDTINFIKSLKK